MLCCISRIISAASQIPAWQILPIGEGSLHIFPHQNGNANRLTHNRRWKGPPGGYSHHQQHQQPHEFPGPQRWWLMPDFWFCTQSGNKKCLTPSVPCLWTTLYVPSYYKRFNTWNGEIRPCLASFPAFSSNPVEGQGNIDIHCLFLDGIIHVA